MPGGASRKHTAVLKLCLIGLDYDVDPLVAFMLAPSCGIHLCIDFNHVEFDRGYCHDGDGLLPRPSEGTYCVLHHGFVHHMYHWRVSDRNSLHWQVVISLSDTCVPFRVQSCL